MGLIAQAHKAKTKRNLQIVSHLTRLESTTKYKMKHEQKNIEDTIPVLLVQNHIKNVIIAGGCGRRSKMT